MNSPSPSHEIDTLPDVLPFEAFRKQYQNFLLFFDPYVSRYREKPLFRKFQRENPDIESRLTNIFSDLVHSRRPTEEQDRGLYEAYCIMKLDGVSDGELFR